MRRTFWTVIVVVALSALVGGTAVAANSGTTPLKATLTGAAERPDPGDPDGSGMARLQVKESRGTICYTLKVRDITQGGATITGAHIHVGGTNTAGPVVQGLELPTDGNVRACVTNQALASRLVADPGGYYVNVHTSEFPNGAVRGQLSRPGR